MLRTALIAWGQTKVIVAKQPSVYLILRCYRGAACVLILRFSGTCAGRLLSRAIFLTLSVTLDSTIHAIVIKT